MPDGAAESSPYRSGPPPRKTTGRRPRVRCATRGRRHDRPTARGPRPDPTIGWFARRPLSAVHVVLLVLLTAGAATTSAAASATAATTSATAAASATAAGTATLRKFISDRGKIRARRVTGVSVQEQRKIAKAVKNAREMALLPYSSSAR